MDLSRDADEHRREQPTALFRRALRIGWILMVYLTRLRIKSRLGTRSGKEEF
jgi:hypothetical protein